MSAFEGLRLLRTYAINHPDVAIAELIDVIRRVEADGPSLDMDAAAYLDELIDNTCPLNGHGFYQACISGVVIKHQPLWSKAMSAGRRRFLHQIRTNPDDEVVFRAAGLLDDPPPEGLVQWWDWVSGHARLANNLEKMAQAREAERLTIEHEKRRLLGLGIEREPEWTGLDDNYAGYDVLSYEPGPYDLINKMIEVKSTIASPLRFYLTRNEWSTAVKARHAYLFHIWDMSKAQPVLYVRTVADIEPHIPTNNEAGIWDNVLIPI